MLFTPPPGYNAAAVNAQNVGAMGGPGTEGFVAQGYNPYNSSYSTPSSYAIPSTVPINMSYYNQPPGGNQAAMAKALAGR